MLQYSPAIPLHELATTNAGLKDFAMNGDELSLYVKCYSGYRGEETPRSFQIGSRQIEIVDVIDRWLGPDHRYFKVRGDDRGVYILRHDVATQRWEMTMFDSGTRDDLRLSST